MAFLIFAIMGSPVAVAASAQPPATADRPGCAELARSDLSKLRDAPAIILSARLVKPAAGVPNYCEVKGYGWRNVEFRVRFPIERWNGKLVVFGTGGQAGSIDVDDPVIRDSRTGAALRKGYATAEHNGGHLSGGLDAQWSYDNESALLDYGFRAPHVAGLVAREIVRRAFNSPAVRVYYSGCSNGGREALQMAQKYPYEYDGIIAAAPSLFWSDQFVALGWAGRRFAGPNPVLNDAALRTLHAAVIAQCDHLDGRRDAILEDPRRCRPDLAKIACQAKAESGCLTQDQIRVAQEIYDGPRTPEGKVIASSSAMPGSELTWSTFSIVGPYSDSVMRFQTFTPPAGPDFVPDENQLADYVRRAGASDAIIAATNPDLRRFKANGGKLLSFMGWSDAIGGIAATIDYYRTVERLMGGRKDTQDFYRLFMIPGMNHCTGGDGAYDVDWLDILDAWVSRDVAPDVVRAVHPDADGKPVFSREIKPFVD
ncbi:hypothetical protein ASE00_16775 [Sphingomonas sp. Root710]|uniref:tannase/feruloyl esterase family alpha/beta hydrolase n=1 Tax=Sphingomonas sp. Root710 TaxID=1736594 RepID=UPI0006FB9EC6|nr:tannase/feruloyl esterase family alpha/beta hydrolase [Sphingomonas sp. Root710]KRB80689.1 hypothetical protein ASE00_16775 [Sphingomonas sp. Root710]